MPDTPDLAALAAEQIRVLREERDRLDEKIGKLEHALRVLTESGQNVNTNPMKMTSAQRNHIAEGARKREETESEAEAFAVAIARPHAGGQGYSMRSLAKKIGASHQYFSSVFKRDFCISHERAELVHKLTGYRFPPELVADKK